MPEQDVKAGELNKAKEVSSSSAPLARRDQFAVAFVSEFLVEHVRAGRQRESFKD